jgi:hypothetical protein
MFLGMRKKVIITIWLNRDGNENALIIAIDVDSQTNNQSRRSFCFDPSKNHEALDLYLSYSWTVAVI